MFNKTSFSSLSLEKIVRSESVRSRPSVHHLSNLFTYPHHFAKPRADFGPGQTGLLCVRLCWNRWIDSVYITSQNRQILASHHHIMSFHRLSFVSFPILLSARGVNNLINSRKQSAMCGCWWNAQNKLYVKRELTHIGCTFLALRPFYERHGALDISLEINLTHIQEFFLRSPQRKIPLHLRMVHSHERSQMRRRPRWKEVLCWLEVKAFRCE